MKAFVILSVLFLITLVTIPAYATQMDAQINPNSNESNFRVKYQKSVFIEYPYGGQLFETLRNQEWILSGQADASDPGVQDLIAALNNKIQNDGSGASISDLNLTYDIHLKGRNLSTSIDYKVIIKGTLTDYVISQDQTKTLIDLGWRGMSTNNDVVIDGVEINHPISTLKTQEPGIYNILAGTEAEEILSKNLIDSEPIKGKPMIKWRFLFDPVGTHADPSAFGLDESTTEFAVSHWIMGISSRGGQQIEGISEAKVSADQNYVVRSVKRADGATISSVGFGALDSLDGVEIAEITPYQKLKELPPLQQINIGVLPENIICKKYLELIFKSSDNSSACVNPESIYQLIERGWAKPYTESNAPGRISIEETGFRDDINYLEVDKKFLKEFGLENGFLNADSYVSTDPITGKIHRGFAHTTVIAMDHHMTKKLESFLIESNDGETNPYNHYYLEYDDKSYWVGIFYCNPQCPGFIEGELVE